MKRFRDLATRWMMGRRQRELMGQDKHGNHYYRYTDSGGERREVEWHAPFMMYDPSQVPAEWRMWLRKLRDTAPGVEEMAKNEQASALLQRRVEGLEEVERQRRLRMRSPGQQPSAGGEPDFARLMGQVAAGQKSAAPSESIGAASPNQGDKRGDGSMR